MIKNYKKYLIELFDSNFEIEKNSSEYYKVNIDDNLILYVNFSNVYKEYESFFRTNPYTKNIKNLYEIVFSIKKKGVIGSKTCEITGENKNMFIIFGNVANVIKKWISEVNPDAFYFTAEEPKRIKLYDKFVDLIEKETNYNYNDRLNLLIKTELGLYNDSSVKIYSFLKG